MTSVSCATWSHAGSLDPTVNQGCPPPPLVQVWRVGSVAWSNLLQGRVMLCDVDAAAA
jgi:hypothetical protein